MAESKIKIFIDDERFPPNDGYDWIIVRSMDEMKELLEMMDGPPDFISFDHDLGKDVPTGFQIAAHLINVDVDVWNKAWNVEFYAHSQNPVGKANIEGLLNGWKKFKSDS